MGSIPIGATYEVHSGTCVLGVDFLLTAKSGRICGAKFYKYSTRPKNTREHEIYGSIMATFKAEVYAHQKKADGTYNIKIRVTQNQKKRYLATTWYVTKDDLTRSLKLKNQKYIDMCEALVKKYRSICDRAGERLKTMSVDEVVNLITSSHDERWDLDIAAYMERHIELLQSSGHIGNAKTYTCALHSLRRFAGRDSISVREITVRFLQDWSRWIGEQSTVSVGYAQHNYLDRLRAVHNKAKLEYNDEDAGIIRIPNSPFSHFQIAKAPQVRKRALTIEQVKMIASLPDQNVLQPGNNRFNLARDLFLLSFGLVGMNAVDMYYCEDCKDGRITYQRTKTRNRRADKAEISILIQPEVKRLVDKYRDPSGERVFVFHKMYSSMDSFSAAINKGLKKIGQIIGEDDLEFYSARHTWATIAINNAQVDKYTVHLSLNHVDESMRVTDIYIKRSYQPIDEANRKVLDLLL